MKKTILAGLIGGIGGFLLSILYNRYNEKYSIEYKNKQKELLHDSTKWGRKCQCQNQYCTCGKHLL
jgi:hypothetical protein